MLPGGVGQPRGQWGELLKQHSRTSKGLSSCRDIKQIDSLQVSASDQEGTAKGIKDTVSAVSIQTAPIIRSLSPINSGTLSKSLFESRSHFIRGSGENHTAGRDV